MDKNEVLEKVNFLVNCLDHQATWESFLSFDDNYQKGLFLYRYYESCRSKYEHYCIESKENICSNNGDYTKIDPELAKYKESVINYIIEHSNIEQSAMSPLCVSNRKVLIRIISIFSLMSFMRNVEDIGHISDEEFENAVIPENVAINIGYYLFFALLVNEHYDEKDYNKLFEDTWKYYYDNIKSLIIKLASDKNWKEVICNALYFK